MAGNAVPPVTPRNPYLLWCSTHSATFAANAVAIGLTTVKTTAYSNLVKAAQTAIDTMEAQKATYHAAVTAAAEAMRNLSKGSNGTSELVATVRAFAESSTNPDTVYNLAQIDPPAQPSPAPAPNAPTDVTVGIDTTNGNLILKWKASQPATGTIYIVKRRVDSAGAWQYIGSAGADKTFTDATFTPGPDSVQYSIQAQRSNKFSAPTAVVVNFGTGGNGQNFAVTGVKMAA
jgi:hypothetical protein